MFFFWHQVITKNKIKCYFPPVVPGQIDVIQLNKYITEFVENVYIDLSAHIHTDNTHPDPLCHEHNTHTHLICILAHIHYQWVHVYFNTSHFFVRRANIWNVVRVMIFAGKLFLWLMGTEAKGDLLCVGILHNCTLLCKLSKWLFLFLWGQCDKRRSSTMNQS